MALERISAAQYAQVLQKGLTSRDNSYDATTQEIPDLLVVPQASVAESLHDDTRRVSVWLTLSNPDEFDGYEATLDGIAFNELLTRSGGTRAGATLVFERPSAPAVDVRIQRGYSVATAVDESTGLSVVFVATAETVMLASAASSYYDPVSATYKIRVPVLAVTVGAQGAVAAGRINRPLRPLVGFTSVTNEAGAAGGLDRESNTRLIDRYLISVIGRELATRAGVQKVVLDDFPDDVSDVLLVAGTDALLTRAEETAGAVDAYILGTATATAVENPAYLGAGQVHRLLLPPILAVQSVKVLATGVTYVEGTDYDVIFDTSGNAESTHAIDGIRFRFTGSAPTLGVPLTITYTYNDLIRRLQTAFEDDTTLVDGRDLLFKQATEEPIALAATLTVRSGFSYADVKTAVINACLGFFATLGLGDPGQASDIQGTVRQISGVDNFVITRLSLATIPSGVSDIDTQANEYLSLVSGNLSVTP